MLLSVVLLSYAYLLEIPLLDMCNVLWNAKVVEEGGAGTVSGVELVILSSSNISFGLSVLRVVNELAVTDAAGGSKV